MSIDDDFIQTIIASPDDDAPRLVYADWLEEQGDPRGEFIRIQCELAKMPEDDPRRWDLELRQGRLLRWYGWQWWYMPFDPTSVRPSFYRGFVEEITVSILPFLLGPADFFHLYPLLRRLTLSNLVESHVKELCSLEPLQRVKNLRLEFASTSRRERAERELQARFGSRVNVVFPSESDLSAVLRRLREFAEHGGPL